MSTWYITPSDKDIVHYGVLGMKWGIRRYQNKDGSLTLAGKRKYYKDYVKKVKNEEDSYNYIKQTISKKDLEQLSIKKQEFRNSFSEYNQAVKKYFPDAMLFNPIDKNELVDAIMMTDKKYSKQYDKILKEAHKNAIEATREQFFTKEENLKMTDNDIEKTRQYNKYFDAFMYDDNKKLNKLRTEVKNDSRLKDLNNIIKKRKILLDEITKEESKIVDDLIGDIGKEIIGSEEWRRRLNIEFSISDYINELLDNKEYAEYINNRIKIKEA